MHVSGASGVAPDDVVGGTPILSRCMWPAGQVGSGGLSNGVSTWGVSQRRHVVMRAATGLELVYAWGGGFEDPASTGPWNAVPANDGTIGATVWKQTASPNGGGAPIDVLFAAATSWTVSPWQVLISDAIAGLTLAQGDVLWTRTLVTVPSGGTWPAGTRADQQTAGTDGGLEGTGSPPVDYLHTGTIPAVYPDTRVHPVMSLATLL